MLSHFVGTTLGAAIALGVSFDQECPLGPPVPADQNMGLTAICLESAGCEEPVLTSGFRCQYCSDELEVRSACFEDPPGGPYERPAGHNCWNLYEEAGCGNIMAGEAFFYPDGSFVCINAYDTGLCCHRIECAYEI